MVGPLTGIVIRSCSVILFLKLTLGVFILGKTVWLEKLLKNQHKMFTPAPKSVLVMYK